MIASTHTLSNKRFTLLFSLLLMSMAYAQGARADDIWLGSTYEGVDSVTTSPCAVHIGPQLNSNLFGDSISVEAIIDNKTNKSSLTNHPIFKGQHFGKTYYYSTTTRNDDGVEVYLINERWFELTIFGNGGQIQYTVLDLGTKHGGLIVTTPRGVITSCLLKRSR